MVAIGFVWMLFGTFARQLTVKRIVFNWDFWRKRLAAICAGIIAMRIAAEIDFMPEKWYVILAVLFGYFPDLALHYLRQAKEKAKARASFKDRPQD